MAVCLNSSIQLYLIYIQNSKTILYSTSRRHLYLTDCFYRNSNEFKMSTRKDVRGVSDRATSSNLDSKTGRPVPSSQPTVSKPLSGCRLHRTRSSNDNIDNPIEYPKASMKYNPPFRRNLRYFGYPEDLNMAIDTPPKVHSWGPLPEVGPKTDKYANEGSAKPNKRRGRDEEQIPAAPTMNRHYMGRLLKKNLLLDNPGLLPAFDRAIIPEGSFTKF